MKIGFLILLLVFPGLSAHSQKRVKPYVGLHVSMDAGAYFLGPSFMAGTDYRLKNKLSISSYIHFFKDRLYNVYPDGSFEKGKWQSYILAFLLQYHLSHSPERGLEIAGGAAVHYTITNYLYVDSRSGIDKRTIPVGALRIGYRFPIRGRALTIELNGVGPYVSKIGPPPNYQQDIEVLTQLSLGTRLIF